MGVVSTGTGEGTFVAADDDADAGFRVVVATAGLGGTVIFQAVLLTATVAGLLLLPSSAQAKGCV